MGGAASQQIAGGKHVLKPADASLLTSFLQSANLRWRDVGRHLGFTHSELSNIAPTGGLTSPQHYFEEMVERWLKWAPPAKSYPCTEDMVAALRQIGEHNLALHLEQHSDFMAKSRV